MQKSKNKLCKLCLNSFKKVVGKKYCSEHCESRSKLIHKKCAPICKDEDKIIVEATFKNGTKHLKKICGLCRRGFGFVSPKSSAITCLKSFKESKIQKQIKIRKMLYKDSFYTSRKWLSVRYDLLIKSKQECVLCGSIEKPLHVDHIKPRSKYPELELNINNLQVLCSMCNFGKSNKEAIP